jgi:hypothetical protein
MAKIKNAFSSQANQVSARFLVELLTKDRETNPVRAGKRLRELLDDHGLSQSGIAREIGISDRTIRRYISGDLVLPLVVAWALSAAIPTLGGRSE